MSHARAGNKHRAGFAPFLEIDGTQRGHWAAWRASRPFHSGSTAKYLTAVSLVTLLDSSARGRIAFFDRTETNLVAGRNTLACRERLRHPAFGWPEQLGDRARSNTVGMAIPSSRRGAVGLWMVSLVVKKRRFVCLLYAPIDCRTMEDGDVVDDLVDGNGPAGRDSQREKTGWAVPSLPRGNFSLLETGGGWKIPADVEDRICIHPKKDQFLSRQVEPEVKCARKTAEA